MSSNLTAKEGSVTAYTVICIIGLLPNTFKLLSQIGAQLTFPNNHLNSCEFKGQ